MTCTLTILFNAIPIPGSPYQGTYDNPLNYQMSLPDANWTGEMVAAGAGFGPCPDVPQFNYQAVNNTTGEVIFGAYSNTCASLSFVSSSVVCPAYECMNGAGSN